MSFFEEDLTGPLFYIILPSLSYVESIKNDKGDTNVIENYYNVSLVRRGNVIFQSKT